MKSLYINFYLILILLALFFINLLAQCPDGSQALQACSSNPNVCQNGYLCTSGFCCPNCQTRRQMTSGQQFVPNCDLQGNYASEQCDRSGCWCVTTVGQEIQGTRIVLNGANSNSRNCDAERQKMTGGQCQSPNEEWNVCPSTCPLACDSQQTTFNCQPITCIGACVCRQGYMRSTSRNPTSPCVLSSQCNSAGQCTDLNSEYNQCGSTCPASCTNQVPRCNPQCVPGCSCKSGFIKQSDVQNAPCILQSQCSSIATGQCNDMNSVFANCGSNCPASCTTRAPNCLPQCVPRCVCNSGFIKENDSPNARCVLESQCNSISSGQCPDINAQFQQCGSSCPPSCITPSPTCQQQCTQGCFCKPGFVKQTDAFNAPCILSSQCNVVIVTDSCSNDINAQFSSCGSNCPPSCTTPNPTCNFQCTQGCFCKSGFVKQSDQIGAVCILQSQCNSGSSQCPDINSQFSTCGSNCPPSCVNPNPTCNFQCTQGCFCKPGFVKQSNQIGAMCVLQNQCNDGSSQCPDINSQFSTCGSNCPPSCTNPNPTCNFQCTQGCFCKPGFVKQNDQPGATCVLQNLCNSPSQCTDINSQFSTCGSNCPPSCTTPNPVCSFQCTQGCACKSGFIKQNDQPNAQCIMQNQCSSVSQCPDPNSQFTQCASVCQPTCTTPVSTCTQCVPGCACKPGFVKQSDVPSAQCVLQSQCNSIPQQCFLPNEELQSCTNSCGDSCSGPLPCNFGQCVPRCMCRTGFIRQTALATSQCILRSQCPIIPGAKAGSCPAMPLFPSSLPKNDQCFSDTACMGNFKCCDTLTGKICMGPDTQTLNDGLPRTADVPQCGPNERYTECTLQCTFACDNLRSPPNCPKICGPPGCVCEKDYVRKTASDPRSTCVPVTSCV